jgi:hypothetical protein
LEGFGKCFQLRDVGSWTKALLDEETGGRMVEQVHGWIACWADGTLRFQVYPARAAPLDTPIPITALAFQRGEQKIDAMVSLLDLLVDLAQRAQTHAHKNDKQDTHKQDNDKQT